ncbi:MAG TPA: hypothetical protein VLC07_09645 [Solirubrobacterales bacterium]|nr:hypothetical protein [Solirubrobacterales bacterium]
MTPELVPSKMLRRAAAAERERITQALERNQARQAALREELSELDEEKRKLEERDRLLHDISSSTDEEAGAPGDSTGDGLKGADLRETAASLFYERHGGGEARHYRHWFTLLAEKGIEVAGKDPIATLLTNLSRSPVVVRGSEPGTYAIDEAAPQRIRSRLGELHAEFADLARMIEKSEAPTADLVSHRANLLSEIRRNERLLAEAERILSPPLAEAA